MKPPTRETMLQVLREGTAEERRDLVANLPENTFRDTAVGLVTSDHPGLVVVGLGSLVTEYCQGSHPEVGAVLAAVLHERARELYERTADHGLLLTTLSGLASNHLKALSLLGRNDEILATAPGYIEFYAEQAADEVNLPGLRILYIEALFKIHRLDDALRYLAAHPELNDDPVWGAEARRLRVAIDRIASSAVQTRLEDPPAVENSAAQLDFLSNMFQSLFGGEGSADAQRLGRELLTGRSLDPNKPEDFEKLGRLLREGEAFLSKRGEDSELTVGGKIREASAIFLGTPGRKEIGSSLAVLQMSLQWARKHGVQRLENDANWGLYLCHSRLHQASEAADALIRLRGGLEKDRAGIADPLKRAGVFRSYRWLFHALCEHLFRADRPIELLEAIESSKGRVIADKLTETSGEIVADSAIYDCVKRLPDLAREHRFHYVSFFVDEEVVYAVLVDSRGEHHMSRIEVPREQIRAAVRHVAPRSWGKRDRIHGRRVPHINEELAPLIGWISDFVDEGVIARGDRVVYSSDEEFHNIPLHYLRFRDGIALDYCAFSRVHSVFEIDRVLRSEDGRPPERYVGFSVHLKRDEKNPEMVRSFRAPLEWLGDHMSGESVIDTATPHRVGELALEGRIVHFSTHGWFPEDEAGNPFHDSYLLLATRSGLPEFEDALAADSENRLTPAAIVDRGLRFTGSHVSTMACISGRATEGIGGDALGLDFAFLQAGASSLISTHWRVSASKAAQLFVLFYEKWLFARKPRSVALREAMLELLGDDRSPGALHAFAAFSLTGDTR